MRRRTGISRIVLSALLLGHISASVTPEDDLGDMIPVTIRPVLASDERPLFTAQSFTPSAELSLCSVYESKDHEDLDCIVVSHETSSYVDLEQIEPLLHDQRVLCDERSVWRQDTEIVLPFTSHEALLMAHSEWSSGQNLIFMAEDEHCFQGPGDRSFYLSKNIHWDHDTNKTIIRAIPLMASIVSQSGWAHNVTRGMMKVPHGYFAHPRASSGYEANVTSHLIKRGGIKSAAALGCLAAGASPFGAAGVIPGCILGASYYAVVHTILDAKDASLNIKIGADIAAVSPWLAPVGVLATALGAILAPSHITWQKHWDYTFLKHPVAAPWGFSKDNKVLNDYLKLPHLTLGCANCHVRGKFNVTLRLDFDLKGDGHKGPEKCWNSEKDRKNHGTKRNKEDDLKIEHDLWLEIARVSAHVKRSKHQRLRNLETRTVHHDAHFKRGNCDPTDITWPMCNLEEIINYHADCDPYLDNILLHPITGVLGGAIKCLAHTLIGHARCWKKFHAAAESFVDFKDYGIKVMQRHLHEAKLSMTVDEDIDMFIHPKIGGDVTVGLWWDLDFGIQYIETGGVAPPVQSWGFLVAASGSSAGILNGGPGAAKVNSESKELPASLRKPGDPDGKSQKGWGSHDIKSKSTGNQGLGKMTWGLPVFRVEFVLSTTFSGNITFPGFNVSIGRGTFEVDLLNPQGNMVSSTMPIDLKYLKARIDVSNDIVLSGSVSVGPAFDFSLTPQLGPVSLDTGDVIMAPLAFGIHAELVKYEIQLGGAAADNAQCKEGYGAAWNGPGFYIAVYLRHGIRLYASILGLRVGSDWAGKTDDSTYGVNGFYHSERLGIHCERYPAGVGSGDIVAAMINRAMDTVQDPIQKAVNKLSRKLSSNIKDAKILKGKEVDTAAARNGTKLSYESFKLQHGLAPPPPLPNYTPDALAETLAQCLAKGAWANKLVNTTYGCDQLGHDTKFSYKAMEEAIERLAGKVNKAVHDKWLPPATIPMWDGGQMATKDVPTQIVSVAGMPSTQSTATSKASDQAPVRKMEDLSEYEQYMCQVLGTCP